MSRRNRIVVLHAGGTIMSAESGAYFPKVELSSNEQTSIIRKLKQRFNNLFGDSGLDGFDFEYFPVPGGPRLSEDASIEYWNSILQGLASIHEIHGDHLAGVIVLHGTDTMAYAAPLIAFRARGLKYPVVLTGANNTPKRAYDEPLLDLGTDAWENIYAAALFITQKGSTLPGVFVSFASRIHFPMNLRKHQNAASGTDPLWEVGSFQFHPATARLLEKKHRFRFENINLPTPYLARIINREVHFAQREDVIRELSRKLYPQSGGETSFLPLDETASGCWFIKVSPAQPFLFTDAYLEDGASRRSLEAEMDRRGVSLVVLGGYKSATLPTQGSNSIKVFCELCKSWGIAIVLTTRSGCGVDPPYGPTANLYLKPLKLMISETAVAAGFHTLDRVGSEGGKAGRRDRIESRIGAIDDLLLRLRDSVAMQDSHPSQNLTSTGVLAEVMAQRCEAPGRLPTESFADTFRLGFAVGIKTFGRAGQEGSLETAIVNGCRALGDQGFGQPEIFLAPAVEGSLHRTLWCTLKPLVCAGQGLQVGSGFCFCQTWLWRGILHGAVSEFGWKASAEARERALPVIEQACGGEARPVVQDKLRTLWIKRTRTAEKVEMLGGGNAVRLEVTFEEPEAFLQSILAKCEQA